MTQAHSLSNAIASLEADVKRIREERDAALAEVQYAWQVGYDMDKQIDDLRAERDAALVANRDLMQIARDLQAECDEANHMAGQARLAVTLRQLEVDLLRQERDAERATTKALNKELDDWARRLSEYVERTNIAEGMVRRLEAQLAGEKAKSAMLESKIERLRSFHRHAEYVLRENSDPNCPHCQGRGLIAFEVSTDEYGRADELEAPPEMCNCIFVGGC